MQSSRVALARRCGVRARACRPAPDTFVNLSPAGLALFDAALDWAAGRR
ncbi:hypothetical protein [Burkholderia ambifaria]|jgi:hypothetical protein|nr:hypothetical protein [Burkholderia ambifaria]MBR8178405.1 hypothetical protein [Burkholderia ambifaria]